MKNVIIISGLAGSGKTYLAKQIKEMFSDKFNVNLFGATQEDYKEIINKNYKEDDLILLEMHPPFDKLDTDYFHIVISKDFEVYKDTLTSEKRRFLENEFKQNNKKVWNNDIVEYNRVRFNHVSQCHGNCIIVKDIDEAIDEISEYSYQIREKDLFDFAHKNYKYMLYHSLNFNGIGYTGTAPSMEKFRALRLDENLGLYSPDESCLDVGCNVGYISYLLTHHFEMVYSIDKSKDNIKCAKWLKNKFFRNLNVHFLIKEFMEVTAPADNIFALAVLHHVAAKHGMEKTLEKLGEITKKRAFIEINEMPGFPVERIIGELKKYFKNVRVLGQGYLPVSKVKVKNRWIIYCDKLGSLKELFE